jgi:hypothetical protein
MQNTAANVLSWNTAETSVFVHITTQLEHCQLASTTGLFCDAAGIGKTHAGNEYALRNENAWYIDCSQVKTKSQFIREMAEQIGVHPYGRLRDVRQQLIAVIIATKKPLFILDEAGDLDYPGFLEIKSLYNATEHQCGWYMMGAQGLEHKMERMRSHSKVGYEEIYDRFGARYQSMTGNMDSATRSLMLRHQASAVLKANMPGVGKKQADEILNNCALNLRRLRKEIIKHRTA